MKLSQSNDNSDEPNQAKRTTWLHGKLWPRMQLTYAGSLSISNQPFIEPSEQVHTSMVMIKIEEKISKDYFMTHWLSRINLYSSTIFH